MYSENRISAIYRNARQRIDCLSELDDKEEDNSSDEVNNDVKHIPKILHFNRNHHNIMKIDNNNETTLFEFSNWKDESLDVFINLIRTKTPFFITNYNGLIQYVNNIWCNLCGFLPEEVVGGCFCKFQGEKTNKKNIIDFCNSLYRDGSGQMEIVNYTKERKELLLKIYSEKIQYTHTVTPENPPPSLYFIGYIKESTEIN